MFATTSARASTPTSSHVSSSPSASRCALRTTTNTKRFYHLHLTHCSRVNSLWSRDNLTCSRTCGDRRLRSTRKVRVVSTRASSSSISRQMAPPETRAPTMAARTEVRSAERRCRRWTRASWASLARLPPLASTSERSTPPSDSLSTRTFYSCVLLSCS